MTHSPRKKIHVKTRLMLALAGSAVALIALAGCSAPAASHNDSADSADSSSSAAEEGTSSAELAVQDSSLGEVVVDGKGLTAYFFDQDTAGSGQSACVDDCVALWPAIETTSDTPKVEGVAGEIGTITAADGNKQITINGLPIYTFANDKAAGDVNGQGVLDMWWAVSPAGEKIMDAASTDSSGSSSPGY